MTTVNITTNKNTVTIDEDNSSVITVATQGPQGPEQVNVSSAVNKSIVYYDGSDSTLKATSTWTTDTLTNGGNF
tara:strand:- start:428 stop:649 length:222 start_codon:yes stop_codon:yes gene_type:complete